MKAFAEHPDQAVQKDVFDAMQGSYMQAWTIKDKLRNRGVKMGDAIARLVAEEYRAADGDIVADLIEEDSILTDETLVERLLMEKLAAHAEAERERLGFAWSQAVRDVDYKALQEFGRVYPGAVDPVGEAANGARPSPTVSPSSTRHATRKTAPTSTRWRTSTSG